MAQNPSSKALSFARPAGVYLLDPKTTADQRPDDPFLTGEMHRITWAEIDNGDPDPENWNWQPIDDAVANLPEGQDLSLFLAVEPCDIATNPATIYTWCDTLNTAVLQTCEERNCGPNNEGVLRPVPWDPYLQFRRDRFYQALADHVIPATGHKVAQEPLIPIINPNLPGGDSGIRELARDPFSAELYDGYTREALFGTVEDELQTLQRFFPGKFIQIGFFTVEDDQDANYRGESLWHYLYRKLAIAEFNGTRRPRVHFFQEDLAAARASAAPDYLPYLPPPNKTVYSFTPNHCEVPAFAFNCADDTCDPLIPCAPTNQEYNNGIVYQSNTAWSGPFDDGPKLTKTINGLPNDGLEAAFNAYLNEYLEVYQPDADHAKAPAGIPVAWDHERWAAGLQSWKDYTDHLRALAPVEGPAGLTVERISATSNTVSWYGVYGGVSYTLQRKILSPPGAWTAASESDPLSLTCTDTASTGSQYAYRVQASNAAGTILSPWSQVAVFVSEGSYDGYVTDAGGSHTPVPNAPQPGIQAGQGAGTDLIGFVFFNTASLGSAATILDAKLRLKQNTNNDAFDSLGTCMVDIRRGDFSSSESLEAADFSAAETDFDVTEENHLSGVDSANWVEPSSTPLLSWT